MARSPSESCGVASIVFIQKDMSYVRYCSLVVGSPEPPLAAVDRRSARHHAEPPCHRQEGQHGPRQSDQLLHRAVSLDWRAGDINNLLDGIGNGVQVLQAANTGITSLQKLVDTAKSIANQALQAPAGYSVKASATTAAPTGAGPLAVAGTAADITNAGTNSLNGKTFVFTPAVGAATEGGWFIPSPTRRSGP